MHLNINENTPAVSHWRVLVHPKPSAILATISIHEGAVKLFTTQQPLQEAILFQRLQPSLELRATYRINNEWTFGPSDKPVSSYMGILKGPAFPG
jgi:hypothetical protein